MTLQLILKFLHVTAAVVFLGDIIITAFWKWYADQTKDPAVIAYAQKQLQFMDKYVLIPSIFVLLNAGYANAALMKISIWSETSYVFAQIFFILSGVIWYLALRPIQNRQLAMAEGLRAGTVTYDEYFIFTKKWFRWGILAILAPIGSLFCMILH